MSTIRWEQVRDLVDAVLDLPADERSAYLDRVCAEKPVRSYVESLVLSYQNANQFLDEPAFVKFADEVESEERSSWIGRRVGPYLILEEIGEGGMGSVYRASRADDQYRREVAIKVVRRGLDTRTALARFKSERQILADLDHPNIARLLEGGSTEDGQPYFVMEYIRGDPLDQYCDQQQLSITERLRLFRIVCSAVQYAHQKLVIHRDIKSSNLLVTDRGVPKLLDFGIAKILAPETGAPGDDQTRTVVRLLTPEYASPEQWRGEPVTTASDVYSLGVVLYELLTGHRPYCLTGLTPQEIDSIVTRIEPEKPSAAITGTKPDASESPSAESISATREGTDDKLRRRLSGDLDNIVLKALRKEPQRRYASVEQFSEDIRRHLDGLPVFARKDTFSYRAEKFLKRHTAAVAAAALVLVSLTTGLVFAVREASIARAQRSRAEQRFNDVRDLANSLIFGVYDSIEDLPGSTAARKLIVQEALQYLDSLSKESQGDPALQRELATAYVRIGDVQGNAIIANLGDSAGALASYQKSLQIRKTLFESSHATLTDTVSYAESLRLAAKALLVSGKTADAWKLSQRATEVAEASQRSHPDDRQLLEELSQDYSTQAEILGGNFNLSNLGNTTEALAVREKQAAVEEKLLALQPNDPVAKRRYAVSLAKMGDQYTLVGRRRDALDYYLRSQAIFEGLAAGNPGWKALDALQSIYTRVNNAQLANGNNQEALTISEKSLAVAHKLSSADSNDVRARISLAIDYSNISTCHLEMNQIAPAVSAINQAISIVDRLVATNPSNGELPDVLASVYLTAGDAFTRAGDFGKGRHYYQTGLQSLLQMRARDPDNADSAVQVAGAYNQFAKAMISQGDLEGADETLHKSLALSEPVVREAHPSEESLYSAAESYNGLGDVAGTRAAATEDPKQRLLSLKQAQSWYERSLGVWSQIKEPGSITPGGYDCVRPNVVRHHLARVNHALEQFDIRPSSSQKGAATLPLPRVSGRA